MAEVVAKSYEQLELEKQEREKPTNPEWPHVPPNCTDHGQPLDIYCYECNILICRDCAVIDHREHKIEFCKKAAPAEKETIVKLTEPLKNHKLDLLKAVDDILAVKDEVDAQGQAVANTIKSSFEALRDILNKREQELLLETAAKVAEKVDALSAQEKALSQASSEVQKFVDYTEQCLQLGSDSKIMSMCEEVKRRAVQKTEEYGKANESSVPSTEADIEVEVKCTEALQQLCQTQAKVIQLPIDLEKCTILQDKGTKHEVGKVSSVTATMKLSNGKITHRNINMNASLISLYNGETVSCAVERTPAGTYSIQFRPTIRGRHELIVSLENQKRHFPVLVTISPADLGEPAKNINVVGGFTGVTINMQGEIFGSEYNGNIVKIRPEGTHTTLTVPKGLRYLRKLATDGNNVYCGLDLSDQILRCDSDGENIVVREITTENKGIHGLAVVGDEVMVSPQHRVGTIMVYDKEMNYKRSIVSKNRGMFTGISSDNGGNLYCADSANSCVQVFSRNGEFLRSFDSDHNGVKILKKPWSICVWGQHVYVGDRETCAVSVFTTDGRYLSSFGRNGSEEGTFNFPVSICVDQDGFVYVADCGNHRIQCF